MVDVLTAEIKFETAKHLFGDDVRWKGLFKPNSVKFDDVVGRCILDGSTRWCWECGSGRKPLCFEHLQRKVLKCSS